MTERQRKHERHPKSDEQPDHRPYPSANDRSGAETSGQADAQKDAEDG